jgi:excisionase family DNA binding protein
MTTKRKRSSGEDVQQELYSMRQTALLLGVSEKLVSTWVSARYIASVKIGHARRIRRIDIEKFLSDRETPALPVN